MARRTVHSEVRAAEYTHKWEDVAHQKDLIEAHFGVTVTFNLAIDPDGKGLEVRTITTPLHCPEALRVLRQFTTRRFTSDPNGTGPGLFLLCLMRHQAELSMCPTFWGEGCQAIQEVREELLKRMPF